MSDTALPPPPAESLTRQVRRAVIWRSGSQIVAQAVQWGATFLVIRILSPSDYGLFAMTQVVMAFANMLDGYGLSSGLVRERHLTRRRVRQLFGMLLLLNGTLAVAQLLAAPAIAAYYRHPQVVELLRVQALMYLTTPFIALPSALLSRRMDFRRQAKVNVAAAIAAAATALGGALGGWGVWTLVAAPFMLYTVRAVGLTMAAGMPVRPSFDFRGAGQLARFGGAMAAGQLFWFVQSQADVIIAGRSFAAHDLGIYTTALFLAQIFVSKVVPPLNEVAFPAYARLGDDRAARGQAFVRASRVVMAAALPFYLGLFAVADPLVVTVLGEKWRDVAQIVRSLALAMPFMTLVVLYAPACDASGRPGVAVGSGAIGAAILTVAFLVGVRHGTPGLAAAWLAAYPLYLVIATRRALPVIGASPSALAAAIVPAAAAAALMAAGVACAVRLLPSASPALVLAFTVPLGALLYGTALFVLSRDALYDMRALLRR